MKDFSKAPVGLTSAVGVALEPLRRVVLERLIRYFRYLGELQAKSSKLTITSAEMGEALDIDPTQVRKDFGAIGLVGISRIGYEICEVCGAIREVFGFNRPYQAVLVGAGHLGTALLEYGGFARYGLQIIAAFEKDPDKVGVEISGVSVQPSRGLKAYVKKNQIRMAILTTPVSASQQLTDRLVEAGVKVIWNFSPTRLHAPPDVLIRNEHISLGLAQVAYHLTRLEGYEGGAKKGLQTLDGPCKDPCPPPYP